MVASAGWWRWFLKRMLVVFAASGVMALGWRWWDVRRDRTALGDVHNDIQTGRHDSAAKRLTALLSHRPNWDEAAYLLGVCENARGRPDAASAAWSRVRSDSTFIAPAILGRAELLTRRGKQAEAEQLVEQALANPGIDGSNLRWFLVPFYWQEGRVDEAERLLESDWAHLNRSAVGFVEQSMKLVQAHLRLVQGEEPDPGFRRAFLRQAEELAPNDDRIWLAKANLATGQGAFDEAEHWLNSCLRHRAEDIPVWKAYLRWAMATNRLADVRKSVGHIPADSVSRAQLDRVMVWLAANRGDQTAERSALERLLAEAPTDLVARNRLCELTETRQPALAAELRSKKTELDQVRARYQEYFRRNQPLRDAAEIGHLAEQLGHWFEARVFLTIATMVAPSRRDIADDLTRVSRHDALEAPAGMTLADLLAQEPDADIDSDPLSVAPAVVTPSL